MVSKNSKKGEGKNNFISIVRDNSQVVVVLAILLFLGIFIVFSFPSSPNTRDISDYELEKIIEVDEEEIISKEEAGENLVGFLGSRIELEGVEEVGYLYRANLGHDDEQVPNEFYMTRDGELGVIIMPMTGELGIAGEQPDFGELIGLDEEEIISKEEAGEKLVDFVDQDPNIPDTQEVSAKDIIEESDLYRVEVVVSSQEIPMYMSKDADYLIQLIPLEIQEPMGF